MSATNHFSFQQLLQATNINDCSIDTLYQIVEQHPYCAVTQFMLSKKMSQLNNESTAAQMNTTSLYFANQILLNYLLIHETKNIFNSHSNNFDEANLTNNTSNINTIQANEAIHHNEFIDTYAPKNISTDYSTPTSAITSIALEITEENQLQTEPSKKNTSSIPDEIIANSIAHQFKTFKQPVDETTKLVIETEPYHTVDYFASQGIKVVIDPNAQDKLSKQVRKFTDWLKQMKNVQTETIELDTNTEQEIQSIANNSNQHKEIITETMAEVLEKQGKYEEAIAVYHKLSFLNPNKSVYFATKINQLKNL